MDEACLILLPFLLGFGRRAGFFSSLGRGLRSELSFCEGSLLFSVNSTLEGTTVGDRGGVDLLVFSDRGDIPSDRELVNFGWVAFIVPPLGKTLIPQVRVPGVSESSDDSEPSGSSVREAGGEG